MSVIRNYLLRTQEPYGSWGNEINTSLAAVSLLNLGYRGKTVDDAIEYLLNSQRNDGGWRIGSLHGGGYTYPNGLKVNFYWGSEEITTALSLEALSKYSDMHNMKNKCNIRLRCISTMLTSNSHSYNSRNLQQFFNDVE